MQNDNAQIKIDSSLLHISTKEGFKEIYFVSLWVSYKFLWILELYTNFCELFKWVSKGKTIKSVMGRFRPTGLGSTGWQPTERHRPTKGVGQGSMAQPSWRTSRASPCHTTHEGGCPAWSLHPRRVRWRDRRWLTDGLGTGIQATWAQESHEEGAEQGEKMAGLTV
jgi:hypothetical protein